MSLIKFILLPLTIVSIMTLKPTEAKADAMDWIKGCLVLGAAGVGGTAMAASASNVEMKNSQALVVAGISSCIVGALLSDDVSRRAEMKASEELEKENVKLKNNVYNIMHDLCVMKKTCGLNGLPIEKKDSDNYDPSTDYTTLKTGN